MSLEQNKFRESGKTHLLVVDDRPENLFAIEVALRDEPCQVLTASSGYEALDLLKEHDCAAILLDVSMPVLDGFQTASAIRTLARHKNTPILFVTAFGPNHEMVERAYAVGAVDYLTKPFNTKVLRAKLRVFIDLFESRRALARQAEINQALEQSKRETVLESALDAVVAINEEDIIIDWNRHAEEIFGWSKSEALGRKMSELIIPVEYRERHRQGMKRFLATGEGPILNRRVEVEALRRGDQVFPAELTVIPIQGPGSPVFYSFLRDISRRRQIEREILESKEKYRDLVEGINHGIVWSADTETLRCSFVSPRAELVTGFTAEEWMSEPTFWDKHLYPEDREWVMKAFREGGKSEEGFGFEHRFVRADGHVIWFHTGVRLAKKGDGAGSEFRALSVDVTTIKESERRLAAQYAAMSALAEATTIESVAPRLLKEIGENLGWELGSYWSQCSSSDELRCLAVWHSEKVLWPDFVDATRGRRFKRGEGLPGRIWEDGQPAWSPDIARDLRLPRTTLAAREGVHAGFWFPIILGNRFHGVLEFVSREVRPPDVELLRTMKILGEQIAQFIERMKVNEDLQRATHDIELERKKFETLFAESPAIMALVRGPQFVFEKTNAAYQQLIGHRDVIGRPLLEALPELRGQPFIEKLKHVYQTGEAYSVREEKNFIQRCTGGPLEEVYLDFTYQRLNDAEGRPYGVHGTAVNVTDKVRAREKMENLFHESQQAVRAREDFLSIASHELRTPLTPLKLQLQLVERALKNFARDQSLLEGVTHSVEIALKQVGRLTALVENLLDVSRLQSGRLQLNLQEVDLSALVQETVKRFSKQLDESGSRVSLKLEEPLVFECDPLRIEQVLTNLLSNAMKYGNGKPIEIETGKRGDQVVVMFRDRGLGISPDKRGKIFERFERAISHNNVSGLGLGLYIVRQIIEAHKGDVSVESELGEGSTFTVTMPRHLTRSPEVSQ